MTTWAKDAADNRLDQDGYTSGFQHMRWFFRVDNKGSQRSAGHHQSEGLECNNLGPSSCPYSPEYMLRWDVYPVRLEGRSRRMEQVDLRVGPYYAKETWWGECSERSVGDLPNTNVDRGLLFYSASITSYSVIQLRASSTA